MRSVPTVPHSLFLLLSLGLTACGFGFQDQNEESELHLISQNARKYDIQKGISLCFAASSATSGWADLDALNAEFKAAIEEEWGKKVGVKTLGWLPCTELPQADVKLVFFDCAKGSAECPDRNASPHVSSIGLPDNGAQNTIYMRRTYQDHYRFDECNGKRIQDRILFTSELEARKKCTRAYGVHEFGHVLGFDHEQYHPEGPDSCEQQPYRYPKTGPNAAIWTCASGYDERSVMNYCGVKFINWDRGLSEQDIACANEFFGPKGPSPRTR